MKKYLLITSFFVLGILSTEAQDTLTLENVFRTIDGENPTTKMYDAQIRSFDEAAKGAKSWMPTDFGTGFWMTPYNPKLWRKGDNGVTGMGQYMLSVQQMFPNKRKQNAEAAYLQGMSAADKERKLFELNQLYAEAKKNYYDWVMIKKKLSVISENQKLLNFMIKDAEIRYKNGLDKLSAYYKAKAELGILTNMQMALHNEANIKRIALNTLMNRTNIDAIEIDTAFEIKDFARVSFDTLAISRRSDLRAIDKEIQLTSLQQNAERAKIKPEFGARYDHMFGFGNFPMQFTLMAMAKVPLGRAKNASRANVESLVWKSEALLQQRKLLLNNAAGSAAATKSEFESKKRQVKLFESNIIPALKKNYQVMLIGYQQNTEDLFTLFDAWDTLNKTQLEYVDQLQQLLGLQVELEKILEIK